MNKLFPIVLALFLVGCDNKSTSSDWTYLEKQKVLEGCMATSDFSIKKEAGCLCLIDIIVQKYSFEDYMKEEAKIYIGNGSEEFMNTLVNSGFECFKSINDE